jgi:MFS family permease
LATSVGVTTQNGTTAADVTPSEAGYPSRRRAWWTVAMLTLLYALSLLDRQIIALLVPDIRRDLGITDFQMGLLQGVVFALFYVTFGLFFGWLTDRFSRRGVISAGVTVWSLATAACGLARNFIHLMGARFAVGAGEAALNPAAYSMLADSFPKRRLSLAISVFGAGAYVGGGVSLVLGGFLIEALPKEGLVLPILGQLSAWRVVFLAAGAPGLLVSLLIWTLVDPSRRGRLVGGTRMKDAVVFALGHWRFFCGHFLGFALLAAAGTGFQAWVPTHLIRNFGIPVGQVVSILAPIGIFSGMGGGIMAGYVCDRLISRGVRDAHLRYFLWASAIQLVFLVLCVLSTRLWGFIIFAVIFQLASGFAGAGPAALQLVTPNNYRGQVSAAYLFTFSLVGTGVGPTAVGALTTYVFHDDAKIGWAIAANALVVMPLAMLCLYIALAPMRRAMDAAAAWSDDRAAAP